MAAIQREVIALDKVKHISDAYNPMRKGQMSNMVKVLLLKLREGKKNH